MRLDFSENAITAKIKALYGRRLTRAQYEELCRKKNTSEIASYLKERTHLSGVLARVQPATVRSDQLESLLRKARYNKYQDLLQYAAPKNREFYNCYVRNLIEIQLILQLIRLLNIGRPEEFIGSFPGFAESGLRIGLDKLARVKSYDGLLAALEGTEYHDPLLRYRSTDRQNPYISYSGCEIALMDCYYASLKAAAGRCLKGKARQEMEDILATKIALENLIILYRLKKYYPDMPKEEMQGHLLQLWRKLPDRLTDSILAAKTPEAYLQLVRSSRYAAALTDDVVASLGFGSQNIRSILSRRYIRRTQQPATAFVSYMFQSEMEIDNILRIIEAVRYGMEPGEIMELLVIH